MLDTKFIRENPEKVKEGCKKKGVDADIEQILELDEKRREYMQKVETLRAEQNKLGKDDIEKAKQVKAEIKELEPKLEEVEGGLKAQLIQLPNLPFDEVPIGEDESANVVLRQIGSIPEFDFAAGMVDLVPEKHRKKWSNKKLEQLPYSCSTFMLYLGLDTQYAFPHHNIFLQMIIRKTLRKFFMEIRYQRIHHFIFKMPLLPILH